MIGLEPNSKYLNELWLLLDNLDYEKFIHDVNRKISSFQLTPLQLIFASIISFILFRYAMCLFSAVLKYCKNLRANLLSSAFNLIIWLPGARHYLQNYQKKMKNEFE